MKTRSILPSFGVRLLGRPGRGLRGQADILHRDIALSKEGSSGVIAARALSLMGWLPGSGPGESFAVIVVRLAVRSVFCHKPSLLPARRAGSILRQYKPKLIGN